MRCNAGSRASRAGRAGPGAALIALAAAGLMVGSLVGQPLRARPEAVVIPIRGEINDVLWRSVQRRVDEAREVGAKTIIFEMHTPGGLVTSALEISKLIKKLPAEGIATVAWVRDHAYSAGALISLSAQRIVMSSRSSIGDCAPIMIAPGGGLQELGKTERAKAESPVLEEFRDSATRNGYDWLLCRAMVTVGTEVWWIENTQTHQRRFVETAEKKKLIDDVEPDERQWKLVEEFADPLRPDGPPRKLAQPIDSAEALLTLNQSEAVAFGLAIGIADTEQQLADLLGLKREPQRLEINNWEKVATWLSSPMVRGILFIIMLMGAYMEFQHPGLIVPGVVALIALVIFLGAPYLAGLADIWTFVVLLIGLVLLAVEIFILPGFGIAGVLGILLIVIAFIGSFVPPEPGAPPFAWPSLQGTWDAIKAAVLTLSAATIVAVFGIALLAKYLPQTPLARRLVLDNPQAPAPVAATDPRELIRVGDVGEVIAPLRPAGQARFGQEVVDVQSQGQYIDNGTRVVVIRKEGMNVLVRPLEDRA